MKYLILDQMQRWARLKKYSRARVKIFLYLNLLQIKYRVERLHTPAGESIVQAAKDHGVDIIVAGSRGMGVVRRTILGSVSDYLVHHSHVPVLVCKYTDLQQTR